MLTKPKWLVEGMAYSLMMTHDLLYRFLFNNGELNSSFGINKILIQIFGLPQKKLNNLLESFRNITFFLGSSCFKLNRPVLNFPVVFLSQFLKTIIRVDCNRMRLHIQVKTVIN